MKPLISTLNRIWRATAEQGFRSRTVGWVWAIALVLHLLALLVVQDVTLFRYGIFSQPHFDLTKIYYVEPPAVRREGGEEREVVVPTQAFPIPGTSRAFEKIPEPTMELNWNPMTVRAPGKQTPGSEEVRVLAVSARLDRVLFMVDVSGSMWTRVNGNGARVFEFACEEVARSVSLLPSGMEFNVIYYSDTIAPLFREPARATPENKERARVFLQRLPDLSGATDFFKALRAAFTMQPDGIFLFTDGITQVASWRVSQQFRVLHETIAPNARVYVVSFSPDNETEQNDLLAQLCNATGGDFQRYPLPVAPPPSVPPKKKKPSGGG